MPPEKKEAKPYPKTDFEKDVAKCESLIRNYIPPASACKSDHKVAGFRSNGNQLYAEKKYNEAILIYNLVSCLHPVLCSCRSSPVSPTTGDPECRVFLRRNEMRGSITCSFKQSDVLLSLEINETGDQRSGCSTVTGIPGR